jgi:large subunit ribosomal protein L4
MKSALTSKVALNELIILDELMLEAPKTKEMISILANLKAGSKPIIITDDMNENVIKSSANIPGVQTTYVGRMNVYEILNSNACIITKEAAKKIGEVYA